MILYEIFDLVRIKAGVDTWDMYDEDLVPGMQGRVIGPGTDPGSYVVEFDLGKGDAASRYLQVDINEHDLELKQRLSVPKLKPKKASAKV
jgi:hypothetical protein